MTFTPTSINVSNSITLKVCLGYKTIRNFYSTISSATCLINYKAANCLGNNPVISVPFPAFFEGYPKLDKMNCMVVQLKTTGEGAEGLQTRSTFAVPGVPTIFNAIVQWTPVEGVLSVGTRLEGTDSSKEPRDGWWRQSTQGHSVLQYDEAYTFCPAVNGAHYSTGSPETPDVGTPWGPRMPKLYDGKPDRVYDGIPKRFWTCSLQTSNPDTYLTDVPGAPQDDNIDNYPLNYTVWPNPAKSSISKNITSLIVYFILRQDFPRYPIPISNENENKHIDTSLYINYESLDFNNSLLFLRPKAANVTSNFGCRANSLSWSFQTTNYELYDAEQAASIPSAPSHFNPPFGGQLPICQGYNGTINATSCALLYYSYKLPRKLLDLCTLQPPESEFNIKYSQVGIYSPQAVVDLYYSNQLIYQNTGNYADRRGIQSSGMSYATRKLTLDDIPNPNILNVFGSMHNVWTAKDSTPTFNKRADAGAFRDIGAGVGFAYANQSSEDTESKGRFSVTSNYTGWWQTSMKLEQPNSFVSSNLELYDSDWFITSKKEIKFAAKDISSDIIKAFEKNYNKWLDMCIRGGQQSECNISLTVLASLPPNDVTTLLINKLTYAEHFIAIILYNKFQAQKFLRSHNLNLEEVLKSWLEHHKHVLISHSYTTNQACTVQSYAFAVTIPILKCRPSQSQSLYSLAQSYTMAIALVPENHLELGFRLCNTKFTTQENTVFGYNLTTLVAQPFMSTSCIDIMFVDYAGSGYESSNFSMYHNYTGVQMKLLLFQAKNLAFTSQVSDFICTSFVEGKTENKNSFLEEAALENNAIFNKGILYLIEVEDRESIPIYENSRGEIFLVSKAESEQYILQSAKEICQMHSCTGVIYNGNNIDMVPIAF